MSDYQHGKIYKIISKNSDLVYIGSTAKYKLEDRLVEHVSKFECGYYCSSCELIKQTHYDIIELQAYPCNSKAELGVQERFWILKYRDDGINVVNINIPSGIVADNMTDWHKKYQQDNKEKIAAQRKQYREDNKDKMAVQAKKYRQENKEKIAAKDKQYNQNNKEKIAAQRKQYNEDTKDKRSVQTKQYREDNKDEIEKYRGTKVTCDCGCEVRKDSLLRHKKTQRHLSIMSTM